MQRELTDGCGELDDQAGSRLAAEAAAGPDPRVEALTAAVANLAAALSSYVPSLRDRQVADEQLTRLAAMAADAVPDIRAMRGALLLVASALGSLSALARPLGALRNAVELFGEPPR